MTEITKKQLDILSSFKCERLSSSLENKNLISSFKNEKGELIVKYLKENGWDEDIKGETAYYLIKDSENIPYFFFSLKCGTLFEPLALDEKELKLKANKIKKELFDFIKGNISDFNVQLLYNIAQENDLSIDDVIKIIDELIDKLKKTKKVKQFLEDDKDKETGYHIQRVNKTMPGIEIVHFCANDNARQLWNELNMKHSMGEVFFWHFIVKIIEDLQSLVGCQYLFLFAADSSVDGSLVNYYKISLKFSRAEDIGTSKPFYDFGCVFMSQEIKQLIENSKQYFEHFNIDEGEKDVV